MTDEEAPVSGEVEETSEEETLLDDAETFIRTAQNYLEAAGCDELSAKLEAIREEILTKLESLES